MRLSFLVSQVFGWQDLQVGNINNQTALLMGTHLLITADPGLACLNGVTPRQLASNWLANGQNALRDGTVTAVAGTTEQFPSWTNAATTIVPILSAGNPGVQLGVAKVTGPRDRVDTVKAVLELDLIFQKSARVMVYAPSTQLSALFRVQGVAVSAVLQYSVFKF